MCRSGLLRTCATRVCARSSGTIASRLPRTATRSRAGGCCRSSRRRSPSTSSRRKAESMARAKKLWRPLKGWHPSEWVAFKNVWQRAEKVIGSDLWLMQRDLRQEFVDGRLIMAVGFFSPNGTETMGVVLEPAWWEWLKIKAASSVTGGGGVTRVEGEGAEGEE